MVTHKLFFITVVTDKSKPCPLIKPIAAIHGSLFYLPSASIFQWEPRWDPVIYCSKVCKYCKYRSSVHLCPHTNAIYSTIHLLSNVTFREHLPGFMWRYRRPYRVKVKLYREKRITILCVRVNGYTELNENQIFIILLNCLNCIWSFAQTALRSRHKTHTNN